MRIKRMAAGLLAVLFLAGAAGCSVQLPTPSSSLPGSSSASASASSSSSTGGGSSSQAPSSSQSGSGSQDLPTGGQAWAQAAYRATMDNLTYNGLPAVAVELVRPTWADPTLVISYAEDSGENQQPQQFSRVLQQSGSAFVLHYEGAGTVRILEHNGKPLVSAFEDGVTSTWEYTEGVPELVYEYFTNDKGESLYRRADTGLEMNRFEFLSKEPAFRLSRAATRRSATLRTAEYMLDEAAIEAKLRDFFFPEAYAGLPAGAPEWAGAYLAAIRSMCMFPYAQGASEASHDWYSSSLELYPPLQPGGPPVVYLSATTTCPFGVQLYSNAYGIWALADGIDGGWLFGTDENGATLLRDSIYNEFSWYRVDGGSLEHQFNEGTSTHSSTVYAYCDSETSEFGAASNAHRRDAEDWLAPRRQRALENRGYTGEVTFNEGESHLLPKNADWPALEAALLDIFTEYAEQAQLPSGG